MTSLSSRMGLAVVLAAIAQVSGEVDQVFHDVERTEALAEARRLANERAVAAGADVASLSERRLARVVAD